MPVTMGDYGPKPSQDYARAKSQDDPTFRKDSSLISQKTQVAVFSPAPDQLSQLIIDSKTVQPLATFCPPAAYQGRNTLTFAGQLMPSVGPSSTWESSSQKMRKLLDLLPDGDPVKAIFEKFIHTADQFNSLLLHIELEIRRLHRG